MSICPCCSNLTYQNCCQPFHLNHANPPTAEALMRARYSAYALHLIDYLIKTTHLDIRHLHLRKDIESWSVQNMWVKLEIISAIDDKVEFKAHYKSNLKDYVHHENSTFKLENKRWFYLGGEYSFK